MECCARCSRHGTIRFVTMNARRGPGLSKTRVAPMGKHRAGGLVGTADARWRDLVDSADVLSEGIAKQFPDKFK